MLLVRYGEIGLKGQNRPLFENQLVRNIKSKLGNVKIEKDSGSILIDSDNPDKLKEVFGISWYAPAVETMVNLKEIQDSVLQALKEKKPKTFRLTVNRSDKRF